MREPAAPLFPAVHSAVEELRQRAERFEVFARAGESRHLRRHSDGSWERRASREVGVACRAVAGGSAGFAACSGSSARAGREAARAALAARLPGPDPLPPRERLGCLPVPPPAAATGDLDARARAFAEAFSRWGDRLRLVDLRVVEGSSSSLLATGDGFSCAAQASGAVVEALLAPEHGPLRHLHWAARALADLDPRRLAAPAAEAALAAASGHGIRRQLADVVLAPAAAARVVAALARALAAGAVPPAAGPPRRRGGAAWHLVDERAGKRALLPLPCDGEGLPVARRELVAGGAVLGGWATWARSRETGAAPGGSVRPSYQDEPRAGPANLVVLGERRHAPAALLAALGAGFLLDLPAGDARIADGALSLHAAAVAVARGHRRGIHPLVELRVSIRRLLGALDGIGEDDASFAFECTVTTPSLLLRGVEIG